MNRENRSPISLTDALMIDGHGVVSLVGAGGKTTLMYRLAGALARKEGPVLTTTTTKIRPPVRGESSEVVIARTADALLAQARDRLKKDMPVLTAAGGVDGKRKLLGLKPEVVDRVWQSGMFSWIIVESDGASQKPLKAPAGHEPVIPGSSKWVVALAGLDGIGCLLEDSIVFRAQLFSKMTGTNIGELITESAVAGLLNRNDGIMKGCPEGAKKIVFLNKADLPGRLHVGRNVLFSLKEFDKCRIDRLVLGQAGMEPAVTEYYDLEA